LEFRSVHFRSYEETGAGLSLLFSEVLFSGASSNVVNEIQIVGEDTGFFLLACEDGIRKYTYDLLGNFGLVWFSATETICRDVYNQDIYTFALLDTSLSVLSIDSGAITNTIELNTPSASATKMSVDIENQNILVVGNHDSNRGFIEKIKI